MVKMGRLFQGGDGRCCRVEKMVKMGKLFQGGGDGGCFRVKEMGKM